MHNLATMQTFVFGVIWTIMVGIADFLMVDAAIGEWRSQGFHETEGMIKRSEVVVQHGSGRRKTSHSFHVLYSYVVGDREYEGDRVRYGAWGTGTATGAKAAALEHPVGSHTKVYYDPANPSDAVLFRGIEGDTLLPFIFLIPFNVIAVLLIGIPSTTFVRYLRKPTAGGIRIFQEGTKIRARLVTVPPIVVGLTALGASGFISMLIIGFGFGYLDSVAEMTTVGIVNLLVALGFYCWRLMKIRSGKEDLVIDESTMIASLPQTYGRKHPEQIVIKQIIAVSVVERTRTRHKEQMRLYEVKFTGANNPKISEFGSSLQAESFAKWLAQRLSLPLKTVPLGSR